MKFKLILVALVIAVSSCGGNDKKEVKKETPKKEVVKQVVKEVKSTNPMDDKGVGPVKNVTIGKLDEALVAKGHKLFKANCTACHKIKKRYIGPALKGVTKRQSPEWIMNMILNPEVMIVKNKTAKELLKEYNAPMANQHLNREQARAIYEYFRTKN